MKRFLSFMMALALLFSMSVNAFAFDDGKGSITITNATVGNVYTLYKIFDASIAKDKDNNTVVAYSMEKTNQFYSYMFNTDGTAKEGNVYFVYNAVTGAVTLNSTVDTPEEEANMFAYLKTMVEAKKADDTSYEAVDTKTATSQEVKFENLPYGYYLIYKDSTAAVTIDSNTPDVRVIDKNQNVGKVEKLIYDEDTNKWVKDTSANVGDREKFEIKFTATNYDKANIIKYYTVADTYNGALWVDFDTLTVKVGNEVLTKGYYYNTKTPAEMYIGGWEKVAEETKDIANAQWYLVHDGVDSFEIVIPWTTNQTFAITEDGFTMTDVENAELVSKYDATTTVYVYYDAIVEHNADINGPGADDISNLKNAVDMTWTSAGGPGNGGHDETDIKVYAFGVNKVSKETGERLAGAEFEVYYDAEFKNPVYVIPTDVPNVYILDDFGKTETGVDSAREKYAGYLAAYLGNETQKNVVVTGADGQLAIIGLEKGTTCYLKETKAPAGYNVLAGSANVVVTPVEKTEENEFCDTYYATPVTVLNSKGIELPSTGGEGTMRMITIGSIVAIAFAVLLITNKKMSVYQD